MPRLCIPPALLDQGSTPCDGAAQDEAVRLFFPSFPRQVTTLTTCHFEAIEILVRACALVVHHYDWIQNLD